MGVGVFEEEACWNGECRKAQEVIKSNIECSSYDDFTMVLLSVLGGRRITKQMSEVPTPSVRIFFLKHCRLI